MKLRLKLFGAISLLFATTVSGEKWSRQLTSNNENSAQALNDWVPIGTSQQKLQQPQPTLEIEEKPQQLQKENDRSEHGRALAYPQNMYSNNQPSIQKRNPQFNFVHPFQFSQFQQNQKDQSNQLQQQPTSQSFFKFEMPSFGIDGSRNNAPSIQTGYQIQHSFGPPSQQQSVVTSPLFSQKPVFPPEFHPVQSAQQSPHHQSIVHRKPIQQNLIEESKPQIIKDSKATQAQNNLIAQRPDLFQVGGQQQSFHLQKPTSFQTQFPSFRQPQNLQGHTLQSAPLSQEEEVQLLYVPYDTLYPQRNEHQQQQLGFNAAKYNLVQEPVNPIQINNFYTQDPVENHQPKAYTTTTTSTTLRPTTSTYKPSGNFQDYLNPRYSTVKPTSKPKPKPHQPPLAMFYQQLSPRTSPKDVVDALSSTKSIAVLDAPAKSAPEIFIGPAGLPTPSGYKKYELPYLSNFDHNNLESNLKETPFFVAPLSYKTPSGFEKIILPEPHVGSIVIHKPINLEENNILRGTNRYSQRPTKQMYITPLDNGNHFRNTTPKQQSSTRLQPSSPTPSHRWQLEQNRVTQAPADYYRNQYQEAIQEVSSPQTYQKPHHQRRPESAFTQTVKPYAQFKPMPSNIANDDYFKSKPTVSSTLAPISSDSPSTTASPSTSPKTYFSETYPTSPEIQTTRGHLYEVSSEEPRSEENRGQFFDVSSVRPSPRPEIETTRQEYYEITKLPVSSPSPRPEVTRGQFYEVPSSTPNSAELTKEYDYSNRRPSTRPDIVQHKYQSKPLFDDEYKIKSYFRQQDIFKNRPTAPSPTQLGHHENIQYTPVSIDYDNPSSTSSYFEGSTLRTTTPKFTFFHPTAQGYDENVQANTLPSSDESKEAELDNQSPVSELTVRPISERLRPTHATRVPQNHKPIYDNEVTVYNHDEKLENLFNTKYDDSPSELPPLTPNLPGLVNALKENERLNAIEKETNEAETTTTSTTLRPTRRPLGNRGRRPTARTSTSSSVSYSSSDDVTTRRPINRVRRPFNTRNNTYATKVVVEGGSTTSRSTPVRNPNRIRYNPTVEERKQFRTRTRTQVSSTTATKKSKVKTEEDNIDYQRDVLKQNYPVFRHPTRKPFFTTTQKPDEVVTVTPNSIKDGFPGLLEPMQIAQQYQQQSQDNYGPGYFPNEEEINPTESMNNEIYPTTTPATIATASTTEAITTTKRSSLFRRQRPRTTTTTEPSVNTEPSNSERYTIRPRIRPDGTSNLPRKVIKVRARTRRPHPASTTVEPERSVKENSYQKVSKFNQDFYNDDYKNEGKKRAQLRAKFNLEPQESQWSPSLTRSDSFKPLNPSDELKNVKFDNEPEIVTAEPKSETRNTKDTYEFNVSAGFGPKINSYGSVVKSDSHKTQSKPDRTVEPTFEELLEQVMSDISREAKKVEKAETTTTTTTTTTEEPIRKSKFPEKDLRTHNRRGVWKKVRVQPTDGFETAESQNIGTQLFNQIFNSEKISTENHKISQTKNGLITNEGEITTILPTTEKPELEITTTMPEVLVPETQAPTFETITSISQEISRSYSGSHKNNNVQITSTPEPMKEVDSTTTRFYNHDYEEDERVGDTITRRIDEGRSDDADDATGVVDDLETQPSLFDEVRSQLKDLFAAETDDEDEFDIVKPNFHPRKHEYTSIQRIRPVTEQPNEQTTPEVTTSPDTSFHKNLMKNVVYATSTSTEVSQETEICYRGRCIKSKKSL